MDFALTPEQTLLAESLRRFFRQEYSFEQRLQIAAVRGGFSEEIWRALAKQGVLGIGMPEAYGGWGDPFDLMVVMGEVGRALMLEPIVSTVVLCASLIQDRGSPAQQSAILPQVIRGEVRLALAHYEQEARYSLDEVLTTVRRKNGSYRLNGRKAVVLDAPSAKWLVVSAKQELSADLSLYLIDRSAPGVGCSAYRTQDDRSAAHIRFDDVHVTEEHLLGAPGSAKASLEHAIGRAVAAVCADAVGAMEAVNELTLAYLSSRRQFGQQIGRFQVLQHRIADMFLWATQARSMCMLATARCTDPDDASRRRALACAKAYIGRAGRFVGQQAVQLHGAMGLAAQCPTGHFLKRLTALDAMFGNVDHHVAAVSDAILANLSTEPEADITGTSSRT